MEEINEENKIKILVVFNSLKKVVGGASRHIIEVANYWQDSCEIDFLISKSGYEAMEKYVEKDTGNIILYSAPFDNSRYRILTYTSRIIKNFLMIPQIKKDYDVIIAPNYLPQNIIPTIFYKRKNSKLVVYFHTVQPALRTSYLDSLNFLQRYISLINWNLCFFLSKKKFNLIFVVNNITRDYFIGKGFQPNRVIEVNNAIPYNKIVNIKQEKKEYEAIYLSRLTKRKGILDLVDIWNILIKTKPSAKICVVGDGDDKNEFIKKIKKNNLEKNIILTGGVSDDEKFCLMKRSKLFLFPSYYEAKPIVLIEALACELPVVAYDLSIYKENYNGYIFTVEMGNIEMMAKKTNEILENMQDYESLIKESKEFVSQFDWEIVAKKGLSDIKKIL